MKRLLILFTLTLTACSGGKAVAPMDHYDSRRTSASGQTAASDSSGSYTVRRGDTLYSISFRYGMDYRQLARINGIGSPYTIYVGQKLKIQGSPSQQQTAAAPKRPTATSTATKPKPAPVKPSIPAITKPTAKPEPATRPSNASTPMPTGTGTPSWRWPTQGPLLSSFSNSSPTRKGIKIAGKSGQQVIAAAGGRVVYSGNGLPRYGNLLIIKHNDVYLSAYAHNDELLVKEGDAVKSGQQIAKLGSTGTQRDQLHFEIRRNGQPVDPLRYLPKQ